MTSVEERLKLKRGQVDPWSTREKLCLASSVVKNGNQNWMSVSRSLRGFGGEPGRPLDWFSQKSCAVQYDNLLTQIETPKRKKRGADGSKSEGAELTPAQAIVKQLTVERIDELRKLMAEAREIYMREKEDSFLVQNGAADDRLDEMMSQIQEEKRQEEAKQEEDKRMYKQREERKLETAWRPHAAQQHLRGPRRASNQSELGSETDNVESPSSSDQLTASDETAESKPASTPTSPLLTSLLKSPSPVTGSQSSILHSAITSQRGASPTITSLLNSSPGVPSSNSSIPQSPNLKSLVSSTLASHDDVPKPQSHSASSSPTLSMLLELPPSTPGKLPELPYSAKKQPTNTPKLDSVKKEPVPDLSNMEVVLPVGTGTKVPEPESKVNLDATDIQQISTDDLEYVVDPSINVVLQEFVPDGLEDEMSVYIVNSDDVETDVNSMLEAAESADAGISEQSGSNLNSDLNRASNEVPSDEKGVDKGESDPVSVVVHTSPVHQSPQRTSTTPSSVAASPRSVGRPSKGNMVARKLVMEEEAVPDKPTAGTATEATRQMVEDSETLSREALENASVLLVQENGQLVNLSESGQATGIIDNIHVIQDSSNSSVVVVHHDDILKDTEMDSNESLQSTSEDTLASNINVSRETSSATSAESVSRNSEAKSPCKSPRKIVDKKELADASPVDKIDNNKYREDPMPNPSISNSSTQGDRVAVSQLSEEIKMKESVVPEETVKNGEEPKEDKVTQKADSSSQNTSEDKDTKDDVAEDVSKYLELHSNERTTSNEKTGLSAISHAEEEESHSADSEVVAPRAIDGKVNRAETPSTEDDNTRDVEPPPPVKRGRGRYPKGESATYSDSVPNSPASSSIGHDDEKEHKAWKKSIMLVYNRIAAHKNASIFLKPITDDKAPNYTSLIHRPQDLQTIKKNIEDKKIRTTDEFQRDILLMFYNAIMYNKTDTPVHDMAREMQEEGVAHLNEYRNTQMLVNTGGAEVSHLPSRGTRGTRTADKRDPDMDGFSSRRGLPGRSNPSRTGAYSSGILGKRKRSLPDDKVTPKRRKEED